MQTHKRKLEETEKLLKLAYDEISRLKKIEHVESIIDDLYTIIESQSVIIESQQKILSIYQKNGK